jgi:hypothetical protein
MEDIRVDIRNLTSGDSTPTGFPGSISLEVSKKWGAGQAQVIRNPAEALEVALSDGKDHVAAGKNMECIADGRSRVINRED